MGLEARVAAVRTHGTGVNVPDRKGNEIARHTDRTLSAGRHDNGDAEIFQERHRAAVVRRLMDYAAAGRSGARAQELCDVLVDELPIRGRGAGSRGVSPQ